MWGDPRTRRWRQLRSQPENIALCGGYRLQARFREPRITASAIQTNVHPLTLTKLRMFLGTAAALVSLLTLAALLTGWTINAVTHYGLVAADSKNQSEFFRDVSLFEVRHNCSSTGGSDERTGVSQNQNRGFATYSKIIESTFYVDDDDRERLPGRVQKSIETQMRAHGLHPRMITLPDRSVIFSYSAGASQGTVVVKPPELSHHIHYVHAEMSPPHASEMTLHVDIQEKWTPEAH